MISDSRKRYAVLAALLLAGLLLVGFGRRSLHRSTELAFTSSECRDPPTSQCTATLEQVDHLSSVGKISLWLGGGLVLIASALEVARALRKRREDAGA